MNWRERLKGDALAILVWSVATCYNCKGKPLYGHIAPTVERRTCNAEAASANLAVSISRYGEWVSHEIVNLEYRVQAPVAAYTTREWSREPHRAHDADTLGSSPSLVTAGIAQSGRAAPC